MTITYIHRATLFALLVPTGLAGCMQGPGFLQQSGLSAATPAAVVSESNDGMTISIADTDQVQTVDVTQGDMAGVGVAFPPGALAVGSSVEILSAADIVTDGAAIDLGLGTGIGMDAASTAVAVVSDDDAPNQPFTVALPLPTSGLALQDSYAKLIVIFKQVLGDGTLRMGLIAREKLTIEGGKVRLRPDFFGVFQAAFTSEPIAAVAPVIVKSDIATKAEVRQATPIVWDVKATLGGDREVAFSYAVNGFGVMDRCLLFVDRDMTAPWDAVLPMDVNSSHAQPALDAAAHNLHGRVLCRDMTGREEMSAWKGVSVPAGTVVVTTPTVAFGALAAYVNVANKRNFVVRGTCSGVGQDVELSVNDGVIKVNAPCAATKTFQRPVDLSSADEGTIKFRASHRLPGGDAATADVTRIKDTVAPVVPAIAAQAFGVSGGSLTSSVIQAGLSYNWVKAGGTGGLTFSPAAADTTLVTASASGTYTVNLTVSDVAGNATTRPITVTFDFTMPSGMTMALATAVTDLLLNGAEHSTNATLLTVTSVGTSTIQEFAVVGAADDCADVAAGGYSVTVPTAALLSSDGSYKVCGRFRNGVGNTEYLSSSTFVRDVSPPAFTISVPAYVNAASVTVGLTTTESITGWMVKVAEAGSCAGPTIESYAASKNISISGGEGAKAIAVLVTDAAGNEACETGSVTLDSTAPSFGLATEDTKGLGYVALKFTSPVEANLASVTLRYVSGTNPPASCATGTGVDTSSWAFTNNSVIKVKGLDPNLTYSFRVCATDHAGNSTGNDMPNVEPGQHRIFVTNVAYDGDLGAGFTGHTDRFSDGLAGADYRCQHNAHSRQFDGNWRALLSDEFTDAVDRVQAVPGTDLRNIAGNPIATNVSVGFDEFWDGGNTNAVDASTDPTWTGSGAFGTRSGTAYSCLNWTTNVQGDGVPATGQTARTDGTNFGYSGCTATAATCGCDLQRKLQCINQAVPGLLEFKAMEGTTTGKVKFNIVWPTNVATIYDRVEIKGQLGRVPPTDCASGTLIATIPTAQMTSNNFEVTPSGGAGRWGFRACVYQTGNIYATTHTATARTKDFAPKEIFLTARAYKGNLGGVAGADTICQHRATVSLGEPAVNPWKAVLSSSVLSAASHIGLGAAALNSISSDAVAAANTFFGGGSISGQPQYDDLGRMTAGVKVWTGSGTTGANSGDNCNDWASSTNTFDGSVGDPDFTTSGLWLDNGTLESCDYSHRLYCIRSP